MLTLKKPYTAYIRECLTFSSCKRMCPLGLGGTQPQRYCVAYTLHPISDEISHFSRQTAMPLTGRSLFTEHGVVCSLTLPRINPGDSWFNDHCDVSEELSSYMVSPSVNFRVSHGIITTNRQIVRTPNLNEVNIWRSR